MDVLAILSITAVCVFGAITSYTDIRYHKARNITIIVFLLIGAIIQTVTIIRSPELLVPSLINIILAIVTGILFYIYKVWAAGDTKIFTVMVMLLPYYLYHINRDIAFPAFLILGFTFSAALIYVFIESMVLFARELGSGKTKISSIIPKITIDGVFSWVTAFLIIDTFDSLLMKYGNGFLANNTYLLTLCNIFIAIAVLPFLKSRIIMAVVSALIVILRVILFLSDQIAFTIITLSTIFIIVAVLLVRNFADRYNYRTIPTNKVSEGMVLAFSTVAMFSVSSVKGLPKITDETTRFRLTSDEVESIKRWENSKYGSHSIIIVRNIPFAPFIFIGTIIVLVLFLR